MKHSVITFLSTTLLCTSVNAANLYVSVSGTGTNCIASDPCSSIQMAIDNASTGDAIKVGAGTYNENVFIPPGKNGLNISGTGMDDTIIRSAGGRDGIFAPANVPVDAIFQIVSEDVTIEKLTVEHPEGPAVKRDLGFFVTPFAQNITIQKCKIIRYRTGELSFGPGSRGVFVIRAGGAVISKNILRGTYQDHIHVPGHDMEIVKNDVADAPRLGIVIIQETAISNNDNNIISKNTVTNSGGDAIQIQSNNNIINKNIISGNNGAAIKLCGIGVTGDCVNPFDAWADANGNSVSKNILSGNGGDIVDNGTDNIVD